MNAEDGVFLEFLKPGAKAKALWRGALDLIFPPNALDGAEASMSGEISAASKRRYGQAAEIARPLATLNPVPCLPDALVSRLRNVAGAFEVPARSAARATGEWIHLVDDVATTGATAEGCARAPTAAGAVRVDVAVVARVKEMSGLTI